jgi:lysophospholipase L1-like esterase
MDPSTPAPRRRLGPVFVLYLAFLALATWEIAGRISAAVPTTPLRFLDAAWTVATGGSPGTGVKPPTPEELKKNAYRPLPYVMYGLKPSWERAPQVQANGSVPKKTSNRAGFRGREIETPKPAGRFRIVCIGGSTTYGDSVGDEETYPVQLEAELRRARPKLDIEVVNAGVPSYTTAESLASLALICLDWKPDAIVLYEGINDLRPRQYRNFDSAYFHYRKIWNGTVENWEAGTGEMRGGINPFIQHNFPADNGNVVENARRAGTGAFRRNLVSLAGIARAHAVKVVFVTCAWDPKSPYLEPHVATGLAEHNAVVREVAAARGDLLVDLAAQFQTEGQFVDPIHMNAAGSAQMGRLVSAEILKGLF